MECKINDVNSEIFTQAIPEKNVVDYLKGLMGNSQVVMLSDIIRVMEKCSSELCNDVYSSQEMQSTFDQVKLQICHQSFSLDYELPLNRWFINRFSELIQEKGFVVEKSLPQDNVTIYGKSQPDMTIYRQEGGYIRGTTIVGASLNVELKESWEVVGASVDFKSNDSQEVLQIAANMIRVAGFLTEKALRKGRIVEEVKIHGLLVSHKNPYCLPFRYHSCLNKSTTICRGDETLLNNALGKLLSHI